MSQKSKINRARRDARQEEEGNNVVKWIAIVLVALALVSAISVIMMS